MDKQDKGTLCTLDEVRDEVIDLLTTQIQKRKTDSVLSSLREKTEVFVDFNILPEVQTQNKH